MFFSETFWARESESLAPVEILERRTGLEWGEKLLEYSTIQSS